MTESLYSLGRWDEASACAQWVLRCAQGAKPRGNVCLRLVDLALLRGEHEEAAGHFASANTHFSTHDPMPQHSIPLARLSLGILAARGRLDEARAVLVDAVEAGFPPGTQRYGWPLASPPPPPRPTPAASRRPNRAVWRPSPSSTRRRSGSPHPYRSGAPTPSTPVPSWPAPTVSTGRSTGARLPRPWSHWNAPTSGPGAPALGRSPARARLRPGTRREAAPQQPGDGRPARHPTAGRGDQTARTASQAPAHRSRGSPSRSRTGRPPPRCRRLRPHQP